MAKAYDRMLWLFILKTLRKFGFVERVVDMVWGLLSNNWYSLVINGQVEGFFNSTRGVKQGDPLSPCLFIISAEVLSRGLNDLAMKKKTIAFSKPLRCPTISHLAFADDMVIFTNGANNHCNSC